MTVTALHGGDMDKPNSGRAVIIFCCAAKFAYIVASIRQKDVNNYNETKVLMLFVILCIQTVCKFIFRIRI